jgi:putative metallohydrolase (TIGR04338 family)
MSRDNRVFQTQEKENPMSKKPKTLDPQRELVYEAESAFESYGEDRDEQMSLEEIHAFVEHVITSPWFRKRFWLRDLKVVIRDGRGRCTAWARYDRKAQTAYLSFPRKMRSKCVVLHEIAHVAAPGSEAAHGRSFCATYLELVRRFMGRDAWEELRTMFEGTEVKFRRPPERSFHFADRFLTFLT